jgi:hypothetical protein
MVQGFTKEVALEENYLLRDGPSGVEESHLLRTDGPKACSRLQSIYQ